jgi:DNA repair protein RadA/Sms
MNIKMTSTKFTPINEVTIPDVYYRRMKCGIEKLDALFGEGILPGSSITLTARAGLGKTTLVLQMLESLHKNGYKVGYCSSEESVAQLAMTCKRLNVQNISVCNEANVDKISSYMDEHDVIVIDSFQGLVKGNLRGRELEKYCIEKLVVRAKETECAVILICHNTKAGGIKGSSLIIHAVDVNMSINPIKEAEANARCITFDKNRFGPATDIECYIEYSGYDFQTEVEVDEQATPSSKSKKKQDQKESILKLKDITLPIVCKVLSIDSTRAGFLLRELQNEGKLIKDGRGADATWVKSELNVIVVES